MLFLFLGCPDAGLTTFNDGPSAEILSPAPGTTALEGSTVTLRGSASDSNDPTSSLTAAWFVEDTEVCPATPPGGDGTSECSFTMPAQAVTVRFEVLDPDGAGASASVEVAVLPTEAPTATITAPTPTARLYSDHLVALAATVADAEDPAATLVLAWTSSLQGSLSASSTVTSDGSVSAATSLSEGEHELTLLVTDSSGKTGSDQVIVTVGGPNAAPGCAISAPASGAAGREGEVVLFEGVATDVELPADQLTVTWSSDLDGALGVSTPDSAGNVTFPFGDLTVGTHVVTLHVTDEVNASCTANVVYTVATPPEVELVTPVDGEVFGEGALVGFEARVSDGEDAPDELLLELSEAGVLLATDGADAAGDWAYATRDLAAGEHTLRLSATDTAGLTAWDEVTVTVDAPPSAPGVTLTPDPARTDDTLLATVSTPSVDPEGSLVTYTFAWFRDGVAAGTGATVAATDTTRGEAWRVVVTPDDGVSSGPAGEANIVIANTPPVGSAVAITPADASTETPLNCAASGGDADGDAVGFTYTWFVDGAPLGSGSTLVAGMGTRGQVVECSALPDDGTDAGVAITTSITLGNAAPAATAVLSPAAPLAGVDTLTCAGVGADADGDAVSFTYAWTVDGVAWGFGATVPMADLVEGDVWTCTATPDDGTEAGAAATASATIGACPEGRAEACPAETCAGILADGGSVGDGAYWIDAGAGSLEVWCDMSTDGGGWTLVATSSDDGTDTWTYTHRNYWDTDATTFGTVAARTQDFKSPAYHLLTFTDLLFVHSGGDWAAYGALGDGSEGLDAFIAAIGGPTCQTAADGYPMTAGTLVASAKLCTTDVYFNAKDRDGRTDCGGSGTKSHTYGPVWSLASNQGCPLDDTAEGGLGPNSNGAASEYPAEGFGQVLEANTGAASTGANWIMVLIR